MKKLVLLFLSVSIGRDASAQQLAISSTTYYGGSNEERFSGTIPTSDGGFLGFGYSTSSDGQIPHHPVGGNSVNALITKHDSTGALQWARVYGGSGWDQIYGATQTLDGGYAVCGGTTSFDGDIPNRVGPISSDAWVIRLDSVGNVLWSKIYGSSNADHAWDVIGTPDGGLLTLLVTGGNDSDAIGKVVPNGLETDWLLIKTDAQGNRQWRKMIGGSQNEFENATLLIAPGGGYYIVGPSHSHDSALREDNVWAGGVAPIAGPVILRLSDSGQVKWCKRYGGSRPGAYAGAYLDTATGDITIIGSTSANDYHFTGNHQLSGLAVWTTDAFVMRVDSGGNFLSAKLYGTPDDQTAYCYGRQPDGTAALGCTEAGALGFQDIAFYVTNATGDSVSTLKLNSARNDKPSGIFWRGGAWTATGTIDSIGFSQGTTNPGGHPRGNLFVSRMEQWPAKMPVVGQSESRLILVPNPTNGAVSCELPEAMNGTLTVQTLDGRRVLRQTLRLERRVSFSVAGWPPGSYVVSIVDKAGAYRLSSSLQVR